MKKSHWLLLLFLGVQMPVCSDELMQVFDQANRYYKAMEYDQAIQHFKKAQDKAPQGLKKDIVAYNLATCYTKKGHYEAAESLLKGVYQHKEHLPDYLKERVLYNYILSLVKGVDLLISKENANLSLTDLQQAKSKINLAQSLHQVAYSHLENAQQGHEQKALQSAIKATHSKWQKCFEKIQQEDIQHQIILDRLKEALTHQILSLEQLGQKQLNFSATKYFLSQQFIESEKLKPNWQQAETWVEKHLKDNKTPYQGVLKQQLQTSLNEYLAALDCLRESNIWLGRLKSAQSKFILELIETELLQQDTLKHCLKKRMDLQSLPKKEPRALAHSLEKEFAWVSQISANICDEQLKALKEVKDEIIAPKIEMGNLLLSRLKNTHPPYDPMKDIYLYQQMHEDPDHILYQIYRACDDGQTLAQPSFTQIEIAHQFFTFLGSINDETMQRKAKRAQETLTEILKVNLSIDRSSFLNHFEDFFLHYNLGNFVTFQTAVMGDRLGHILEATPFQRDPLQKVHKLLLKTYQLCSETEVSREDFNLRAQLTPYFNSALLSLDLFNIQKKDPEKILLQHAHRFMSRIQDLIQKPNINSQEILQRAIEEQELALHLAQTYPNLSEADVPYEEKRLHLIIDAQQYPIHEAKKFEPQLYQEMTDEHQNASKDHKAALASFQEGYHHAKEAYEHLKSKAIDWDTVFAHQQKALECWRKLSSLDSTNQNSSSQEQSKKSAQQESSSESLADNSQSVNDDLALQNQSDDSQSEQKIMDILERLNQMQDDDKIIQKQEYRAKEGLRPW